MATIELSDLDARAVRAFVYWLRELEANGTLEMYDYQKDTLEKIAEAVNAQKAE